MEQSTKKQTIAEIKKFGFYAYTKDLEKNGLGVIIFDISATEVLGIKMKVGAIEKYSAKKEAFNLALTFGILEFVQILPKMAWKPYKKIYEQK
jgi:hypothetical protein